MKIIEIFDTIIGKMQGISYPFAKFLKEILLVFLFAKGKHTFTNLARYSSYEEKTFRRNYEKRLDLSQFTQVLLENYGQDEKFIACSDASFIPKSGKETHGLAKFWSGTAQKAEKGLEISVLSLIGLEKGLNLCLSVEQTPADLSGESRLDFYLAQIEQNLPYLKDKISYWLGDGFYAKDKMWKKMEIWGLSAITKLRFDAALYEIYEGEQKKRGRKRVKGEKISWKSSLSEAWKSEGRTEKGHFVYSRVLYSAGWKRKLKISYVDLGQGKYALLASNDLKISGLEMWSLYSKRFQIEFMFRDTKQYLGLTECQSRKKEALSFHFQMSMLCYNFCRLEHFLNGKKVFSVQNLRNKYFNVFFVEKILMDMGFCPEFIKNMPQYQELIKWGCFDAEICP